MKKTLWVLLLGLFVSGAAFAADEIKEGVEYKVIEQQKTDSGDKVEVLEFFWYGCPHCYAFEPFISKWEKSKPDNVVFKRIPAVFRPSWKVQARTYYALEAMGKIQEMHSKIFDAIHKDRIKLNSLEQVAKFVSKHGVDKEEFVKQYRSFSIDGKVRKANKLLKAYKVSGVPYVAINGKYVTDGRTAGSYDTLIKVIEKLVEAESK